GERAAGEAGAHGGRARRRAPAVLRRHDAGAAGAMAHLVREAVAFPPRARHPAARAPPSRGRWYARLEPGGREAARVAARARQDRRRPALRRVPRLRAARHRRGAALVARRARADLRRRPREARALRRRGPRGARVIRNPRSWFTGRTWFGF